MPPFIAADGPKTAVPLPYTAVTQKVGAEGYVRNVCFVATYRGYLDELALFNP